MNDDKSNRIESRRSELLDIFGSLDGNKLRTATLLIDRASFMSVELEDLEQRINANGWTEEYQNGENQRGVKRSADADVYLNMTKTFAGILKQLLDLCPEAKGESRLAAMMRQ